MVITFNQEQERMINFLQKNTLGKKESLFVDATVRSFKYFFKKKG